MGRNPQDSVCHNIHKTGRNVKKSNKMNGINVEEEVQAKAELKFLGPPNQEIRNQG